MALEDNEDQESEQENEDDGQQTVLQNAQRVGKQRRAMARRTIQEVEEALDGETPTKRQWQKWKFSLGAAVKPTAELDQTILGMILQIPGEDVKARNVFGYSGSTNREQTTSTSENNHSSDKEAR